MAKKITRAGLDQFVLRLPPGMRDRIANIANENARSMNTEIVSALEKHIEDADTLAELWQKVRA